MLKGIITAILELIIVLPLVFVFRKKDQKMNYLLLFLFFIFFILNSALLRLPRLYPSLDLIGGNWNWSGKLYALIGTAIIYFLFRKNFSPNQFIRLKQEKGTVKQNLMIIGGAILFEILLRLFFDGKRPLNIETLAFQISMPGIEEEFAFRGLMLGILATILHSKIELGGVNLGNPAIYITAILFGFIHAFGFDENWHVKFEWVYFLVTGLFGFLYGWMTLRSRSILMPVISHNLSNFSGNLFSMIR